MVLLVFSFFLFLGVAWSASYVLSLGEFGFIILGGVGIIYILFAYFAGDRLVLSMSGAKEVTREEHPFLYNIVEGMALAAAIPMPKIYVIESDAPNAFATGKDPKNASIAVTTGLLKIMKREELEGVVAHEMSHIGNLDIRFMLYAVVIVGAIALLGDLVGRMIFFGGSRRDSKGSGALVIIALVFMILAPIFAELVRLAISRQREFLADATAAKITRYPEGLASALEKLSANSVPLSAATSTTAPLYIVNPFAGKMGHLFSTHPPIEERVKRLRNM
jgi:heat shock protein HtpX